MVEEPPNAVYTRCGVVDPSADDGLVVTVYDTNHKFQCKPRELQEIGVLSGVSDCAVTEVGGMISLGRYLKNRSLADITNECLAVVTSPSDAIESAMKRMTNTFKYGFTTALLDTPSMMHGNTQVVMKKLGAISRMSNIPSTTVGMKLRIEPSPGSTVDEIVIHNPSGMIGFNIFNSSPVYFEAHNDMDLLIMMTTFLKHNGMWGEMNANMDLYKFDYAGLFFDSNWCHHERSFTVVRAQLLNSYHKCKTMIRSAAGSFGGGMSRDTKAGEKRSRGGGGGDEDSGAVSTSSSFPSIEQLERSTIDRSREALVASLVAAGGDVDGCTHPPSLHVLLDGQDQYGCIACFSTLFYAPENATAQDSFVVPDDVVGAQAWINERLASFRSSVSSVEGERYSNALRRLAEITQQAHDYYSSAHIPLGSCGRRWNWPPIKASSVTHEFVMYSLAHILKAHRDKMLPRMDVDFLYGLMNPFGKMLLLFMHNCAVLKIPGGPKFRALHSGSDVLRGMAEGKWWTVNFVDPSVWSFQITKCQVEREKTMEDLACLETLQRLPLPGDVVVDDRLVFKGFCRGESLGSVGRVVSDITQSVKNLCMVVENRLFSVDEKEMAITSTPGVTDPLFSLEVTGFRPNRAPGDTNSGRVNSRVMRILGTREGARVWLAKDENAIVFEKVNHDKAVSTEAMERAIGHHRILYYDIETTSKNFMDRSAVITSIGFCLCTGGNIGRGGTRGVFGLVAPGTDPAEVERQIVQMYPRRSDDEGDEDSAKDYDVTKHPPQIVKMFASEFEVLLAFGRYVEETRPHVISGWNSTTFDDPFILTRIVKHLSCYNSDRYIEMTDPGSFAKYNVSIVNMLVDDKISCDDEKKYAVFGALFKKLGREEDFNDSLFCAATRDRAGSVFPPKTEQKDYEVHDGGRRWRYTTATERLELANIGMFKYLGRFVDGSTGLLNNHLTADLLAGANNQAKTKFRETTRISDRVTGSSGWFQNIMGGLCSSIRLDLMKVCEKAYKDLSEFNLNAVLAKVSNVADRFKNVKDEVDLHYHLLGFLNLKNAKDQATVHVYCCKDAYLTGVVSTSIDKEGEVFRLSMDSALTESVVTANLTTPLCIGEGAICRNMGEKRADRKGVGIRRHSIATDTKGGMVSQPIVNHVPYQTIDMTSLYPMTMGQNNLCTSTFVSQRQIIELRDRMVLAARARAGGSTTTIRSLLDIIDECNYRVLERYRPIDIAVASWKSNNTDKVTKSTRLERKLGVNFWTDVGEGGEALRQQQQQQQQQQQGWSMDAPPNMNLTAAGMDFFPEVLCDMSMQCAAKVNDDLHIAPASLEYMLMVLPIMLIDNPCVGAHITAGQCQTAEAIFEALEKDFNDEEDAKVRESHWTFAGNCQTDFCHRPVRRMAENIIGSTGKRKDAFFGDAFFVRLVSLLDKIYRRVNVFDSADDEAVRRWSSRLINVGMLARTWNVKTGILHGVIPSMQVNYRADRVVMQNKAKEYAKMGDMRRAGLNKVGQNIMKLGMNSMYGCLALKARSNKIEFLTGSSNSACNISNSAASGGLGGGTRHSVTANQITENARCVFGNIGCCLQMALPGTKQTYGDTDSFFCVHNIVGDGGMIPVRSTRGIRVYRMDVLLKHKMATIIPILVNAMTKGIRFVSRRDAGIGMMSIAHERLAVAGLLFAKKTYPMLHFNEGSATFSDMLKIASGEMPLNSSFNIDKFASFVDRPSHAEGYVVPHNPNLIFRAATRPGGKVLAEFLAKEGITDVGTMREWFSSSPLWMDLDATVINNLYASKIVLAGKGVWIDAVTSQTVKDPAMADAISQANDAFTPYRKGAFVKNSISSTTKLKGLQSLISRCEKTEEDQHRSYETTVSHHVANFASHTTNPSMMITTSRVNKLDITKEQNRPNPLALSINNHLHPSDDISLSEKFKTVTSASAWSLIAEEDEIPPGYFNLGGVRWNPDYMKGSVPAFMVKNLSVVPNFISTVYKMMEADKIAVNSMVTKNADVLCSAAANNGFSLRQGALSFNTGVIVTKDVAMACIRLTEGKDNVFLGGRKDYIRYDAEDDDDDDDEVRTGGERSAAADDGKTQTASASSPPTALKGDIRSDILSRLVNATCSSCLNVDEREKVVERSKGKSLRDFIVDVLKLDGRVAGQMEELIRQHESVREVCYKKKQPNGTFKSKLDDMVAQTKVEFFPVLRCAGDLTREHWTKCPVSIPEWPPQQQRGEEEASQLGVPFEVALNALVGKYKCTKTCDMACCQSLYFVLLYTLALKIENERRVKMLSLEESANLMAERLFKGDSDLAREMLKRLQTAKRDQTVKTQLASNYNYDTDTVVFLFEPSRVMSSGIANMSARAITEAIKDLSSSTTTGKMWNFTDKRFFGQLRDRESQIEEMDADMIETEQHLNFITGVYHVPVVELAAACFSCIM